jgi:predicted transcriptional regulator
LKLPTRAIRSTLYSSVFEEASMPKTPSELSDPISLRLPVDLLARIEKIAEACERPRSWVIVRALKQYAATEGADVLAAAEGLAQVQRGEFVDMDDVIAEMDRIIDADQAA